MGWLYEVKKIELHPCLVPDLPEDRKVGSLWQCDECGAIWKAISEGRASYTSPRVYSEDKPMHFAYSPRFTQWSYPLFSSWVQKRRRKRYMMHKQKEGNE